MAHYKYQQPGEIPSIYVEDTTRQDDYSSMLYNCGAQSQNPAQNAANLDIFKKISALLDNSIDLSSLTGLAAQQDQHKPAMSTGLQASYHQQMAAPAPISPVGSDHYMTTQPITINPALAAVQTVSPHHSPQSYTYTQQPAYPTQPPQQAPPPPPPPPPQDPYSTGYNVPITTYQIYNSNAFTQLAAAAALAATQANQQRTNQQQQQLPFQLSANSEAFIPGAISNQTLEHLTESSMRPFRAIKGENRQGYTSTEQAQPQYNVGTIGDRQYVAQQEPTYSTTDPNLAKLLARSVSPADSDSSGFSSGTDGSLINTADTATLVELMNSLSLQNQQQAAASLAQTYQTNTTAPQNATTNQTEVMKALGLQNETLKKLQQNQMNDFGMSADLFANRPWTALNTLFATNTNDPYSIEKAAKLYRNAATICEPTCTWSGQLPQKVHKNPTYSCKVFLGGVPWDINEIGLQNAFKSFGPMKIEWPGKEGKHPRCPTKAGYVYILFESEKSVKALLQACTYDFSNGGEYFFKLSSRRVRIKEVQVIPWVLSDSNYVKQPSQRLEPTKTVFVGALHGMMNAEGLAHILNDLFGNVVYAGVDTDKHKYPIGSGRVTFSSHKSYMKAVNAAFVEVKTPKFTKKIQIDPYLEDSVCKICNIQPGPYFCRDLACFRYYCRTCWGWYHSMDTNKYHKPLMRNSRNQPNGAGPGATPGMAPQVTAV